MKCSRPEGAQTAYITERHTPHTAARCVSQSREHLALAELCGECQQLRRELSSVLSQPQAAALSGHGRSHVPQGQPEDTHSSRGEELRQDSATPSIDLLMEISGGTAEPRKTN